MMVSQIGYSQSASLLAHNLIEAGDFLDEVKNTELVESEDCVS